MKRKNKFEIKKMQEKHLEDVYFISLNQFKNTSWKKENFLKEINLSNGYVCLFDDLVAGYIVISVVLDEMTILDLAVKEKFKRQKVATNLLNFVLEKAKTKQIKKVFLEVKTINEPAKALYDKFQFKFLRLRPKYYKDDTDCYELMKNL